MAITQKDIEKLSQIFATKDDLKRFATKDDLNELKTVYLDKILKKIEDITLELKLSFSQYKRHDEILENHEKRISVLEVKT